MCNCVTKRAVIKLNKNHLRSTRIKQTEVEGKRKGKKLEGSLLGTNGKKDLERQLNTSTWHKIIRKSSQIHKMTLI